MSSFVCPVDGTQLVLVNSTNLTGDPVYRWECPIDDWAGPWYSNHQNNEPIPELRRDVVFIGKPITAVISNDPLTVDLIDDYDSVEAIKQNIEAHIDTTFVFSQTVRLVRITNWNPDTRILVKDSTITSDTDITAARVGRAASPKFPAQMWFPLVTNTIHLRARVESEVTVEGYFGSV